MWTARNPYKKGTPGWEAWQNGYEAGVATVLDGVLDNCESLARDLRTVRVQLFNRGDHAREDDL
jgi:hypothetical protein